MFFLVKYSKSLEEGSFRNRSADFLWMLVFGAAILVAAAPWVNIQFLGSSLTFMMVRFCEGTAEGGGGAAGGGGRGASMCVCVGRGGQRVAAAWEWQRHAQAAMQVAARRSGRTGDVPAAPATSLAGVCVGQAAPICEPLLPGHIHIHSPLPALGAAGLLG